MVCGEISGFCGGEVVEENWVGCGCEIDRSFFFGLGLPEWDPRDLGSGCVWGGGGAIGK